MHTLIRNTLLLLTLMFSGSLLAMELSQAMTALPAAKAAGQVGEQADGYLGVVRPGAEAESITRLINQARRAEYQRLATENRINLGDVEAMAGKKAIERTPAGQYIRLNGGWTRK